MPWQDRIKEGSYTSPSGVFSSFLFENLTKAVTKKTTAFNFPDFDGTFVQDLGNTGRRYPMRLIFSGSDYDEEMDVFEELLLEKGIGVLDHPFYGRIDVVPFGQVTRRDDLKDAGNQGILEVTFWETVDLVFPFKQTDPEAEIELSISNYNLAQSEDFEELLDVDKVVDKNTFKSQYLATVNQVKAGLKVVSDTQAEVQQVVDEVFDSINLGIDTLIGAPLTLAFQTSILLQTPARALTLISDKLSAYGSLFDSLTGTDQTTKNGYANINLSASGAVTGSVISAISGDFSTRPDALVAAESILKQLDDLVAWQDKALVSLGIIDTGGSYQKLKDAVTLTAGFLVQISFSLKQERRMILTRNRTVIDLTVELYGSLEGDNLDRFISTNNLTGDEIIELPKGFNAVYFV